MVKKQISKNIIITSSGTGGHIYPGIALAKEFKSKGYNPIFFISDNNASVNILKNTGVPYVMFNISGMPRKISFSFARFLMKVGLSFLKSIKQIIILKPLIVIGTGGYVTVPVLVAGKILRKKIFIHEQNTIPGKANIFLNKISDKTFISFQSSQKYFKNKNISVSGCPIRKDVLFASKEKAVKILNLRDNVFTILVFGGSIGSVKLNEIACEMLLDLLLKNEVQVIHITGSKNYAEIQRLAKKFTSYKIFKYMHNIADAYAASDVIISRSGAGTIFELKALNKLAILVPYPYATDDHQYWNAKELEKRGRAIIIEEKNLTKDSLSKAVYKLKNNMENKVVKNITNFPQKMMFDEIIKCIKF
ncbi:MAG: undecaprenyldiphospho-muramoylpentapeptide beta-N-acetylglucosaminyltransferase [Endomicrobium sp.]|jgi:UDP-N-acetylglucosamine--N-acetylmuramyl-(pentapeptide) pyrophosphoryl-undecaprenol N-acetylglucosamine transferase|nr:undecaprenyldiphospho-muramoylpentapeptide beta-N-acetylglucosaminyltransferase [Endomicrobium sp.]